MIEFVFIDAEWLTRCQEELVELLNGVTRSTIKNIGIDDCRMASDILLILSAMDSDTRQRWIETGRRMIEQGDACAAGYREATKSGLYTKAEVRRLERASRMKRGPFWRSRRGRQQ